MTLPEDQLPQDDLPQDLPKVFLSYSRKDRERAQRISDVLRDRSFGVFKDTDDILPTEEWRDRLKQLIEEADTIVFLLSPHSATSEICAWEVEYATSLNKRIAPIVIDDVESATIPEQLARLNYIFCTERDPFEDAIDTLVSALNTDIDWIREHTRLNMLVRRWVLAGRPSHLLLRGQEILDAESWRDSRPDEAPLVTREQAELISESRKAATQRQRMIVVGAVAGLMLAIGLAAFAFFQRSVAIESEARAIENEQRAVENEQLARDNEALAKANAQRAIENEQRANETRDAAWLNQSAVLTDWAEEEAEAGDATTATMLLLAALPDQNASPDRIDAARPLYDRAAEALMVNYFYGQEVASLRDGEAFDDPYAPQKVVFSPDGARFLTLTRQDDTQSTLRMWRTQDGALLHRIESPDRKIVDIDYLPDGSAFMTLYHDHEHIRWDAQNAEELSRHTGCALHPDYAVTGDRHVVDFVFSQSEKIYATQGGTTCLWNTEDGQPIGSVKLQSGVLREGNLTFIGNDRFLLYPRRGQVVAHLIAEDRGLLVHQGTGTMYAYVNAARDRLVVADTGTGPVAPSQRQHIDVVPASTVLLDLADASKIAVLSENEALVGATFSDDGKLILAAQETRLKTWDARTGELLSTDRGAPMDDRYFAQSRDLLRSSRFAPDSGYVYAADYQWSHRLWNARGRVVDQFRQPALTNQFFPTLAFGPRIDSVVEMAPGTAPTLWRIGGARSLHSVDAIFGEAGPVPVDAETRAAIAAYFQRRSESKLQGGDWPGDTEPETVEARQPNGSLTASATRNSIRIADTISPKEVAVIPTDTLKGLTYRHRTPLISADGAYLIVLAEDFIDVLSTETWEPVLSWMSEDASLNNQPPVDYFDAPVHWQFEALKRDFKAREWSPSKDDYAPRFLRMFGSLQQLIDHQKAATPRCLNSDQLERYRLGEAPPRWCITGPGREAEKDPANWQPKPPYDTPAWRDWLVAYDVDPSTPLPGQ